MKGRVVLLDHVAGREAAALMVDGRLEDLLIDPPHGPDPAPGAICRAVLDRPMKGQGGAFVDLGGGVRGYLRQAKGLSPGARLLVQVGAVAEPGKAAPVTPRLLIRSRYVIVTPGAPGINVSKAIRDEDERDRLLEIVHDTLSETALPEGAGLILRSACDGVAAEAIADDLSKGAGLSARLLADTDGPAECLLDAPSSHLAAWRDWAVPDPDEVVTGAGCFEAHGVPDEVAAILSAEIALGGGASARIEPTRALVAVDVNTGADGSPASGLKANLALARALPRRLRLRGLGGAVVLDPAPMPKKDRRLFEDTLRRETRLAGLEAVLAGWTPLGHFELQVRRDRLPLDRTWPA